METMSQLHLEDLEQMAQLTDENNKLKCRIEELRSQIYEMEANLHNETQEKITSMISIDYEKEFPKLQKQLSEKQEQLSNAIKVIKCLSGLL